MKDTLGKLSRKKIIISAILIILLVFMVGLIVILKPSIKNIKISNVLTDTKTLSASVIDGVSEEITSNNYDEIKYQIKIEKENDSDEAIITGTLTNEELKYARFKDIKDGVVTNNGKDITITTTRKKVTITVIVENAPYGVIINPKFNINSLDENNSKIDIEPVTITGKSVEGTILDDNGRIYGGIELGLYNNNQHVKSTYTKEDGKYVFSLGDLNNYEIRIEESKYKIVRYIDETTDTNRKVLNISIKEVEPFNLDIRKTISKLDLIVNGKKETFNYDDEYKVVKSIKNAKTIEGSIYYNIYLKNNGEVKGTLTVLKDAIPNGLSFDESKNPGWTKEGKYLFYTPLEETELNAFEKTSVTLVLDIEKTDEAKTYLNSVTASGDDYKYVAYYLNGSIYKEEYVVNSEKIDNIDPQVENFAGWYTDREYSNKYNFNKEVTKDTILYGKINDNKYTVTFIDINPNNNAQTILDIKEVREGEPIDLIDHPEYNGYTFKCFTLYDSCYQDELITSDTEIYTSYTINNYEIEYDLNDGVLTETNPTSYTVKDEITLNNPTKEGHTFLGWTGTGLSEITLNVTIPVGSTGKREYTANYVINKSTLTINPNGGTYEDNASLVTFTEDYGTVKVVSESVRRGYTFKKYDKVGGGSYQDLVYTFDNDNATLTADYEIITYTISYDNITDTERTLLKNKTEYNVESETFTLNNPNTRVDTQGNNYQDFLGWDDGNGNVSLTVTIPKGSIGDRTYTAVWRENEDDYGITYELHGGSYEEGKSNPSTYTRQTNTFTLNNPNKNGYTFTGWTGTGLSSATETVTILKGSAGDRAYEANYQVIPYEIRYHGLTPSEEATFNNPTGYNIESSSITLTNPTRTGYEFIGWSGTDITDKSTSVIIPTGSIGNREYTANFQKIEYSLTYTLNGGDYETGKSNPDKYTIESNPITLNNPSKAGYTFKGWSGTDLTGNENTTVIIPTGSIGHRSFLANYTPVVYNISYDYNGGNLPQGVINPDSYTIESDEITFNTPEKEGYTFTHYSSGNDIITSIPTGSTGDVSLKANYEINHYTVTYHNESIQFGIETVDWNETANKPASDPEKAHNIFLYWSEDGINEYDFSTKIIANKDLYAIYEEVLAPSIIYTPTLDETTNRTWVCNNPTNDNCGDTVTITSGKDDPEYTLYYKIGDGDAVEYTGPFKVYENATIRAFAKKNNIYSADTTENIINVDGVAPTINNPGTGATSFNISISGTAQDAGSGVKQFTLYVKEKDALTYDERLTFTSDVFDGVKDHAENYDHIFYGIINDEYILHDDTEYVIKIVSEDYVGNVSEKEVEVKTHPYVARVVGKNGILWYTVDPDTKEFVLEDGKEFLLFDSIQAAVDYCAEIQCTIQTNPIFPVVNETVTIGSNQDITIDLDGRGITSNENATFINNGKLQIVDRNPRMNGDEHESIGFVKGNIDKAIINNNIFVLGDGSSEPSETFIYPELDRPIIEGKINAIEQNNEFHFYDGKLVSEETVILDHGDDAITQYSYNVILTGEDDKNIATLDRVTDPEARIKSTYYAKLKNNTFNAFDSSRTGTIGSEDVKILSRIKQPGDYGFIYDSVNNLIYSGTGSTANTTALSYLKLDLTNENEGKFITFDSFIDSYNSSSVGTVSVSETFGDTGTIIHRSTGNSVTKQELYYLEKGKVYYIYFKFVKAGGDVNPDETFKIYNFNILGERNDSSDLVLYNDPDRYSFIKQADGTYLTNNPMDTSTAHSYMVFDLRNEEDDVDLFVNYDARVARVDAAWIYTSNNSSYQNYDVTTNRYAYYTRTDSNGINAYENRTVKIPLKHGEVTYVHFGYYYRRQSTSYMGSFRINSIGLSKSTSDNIIMDSPLSHNSGDSYYFTERDETIWKDLSGNSNDFTINAPLNDEQTGFVFDGTNYGGSLKPVSSEALTNETVEVDFSTLSRGNQVFYIGSNKENIGVGIYSGYIIVSNKGAYNTFELPDNIDDGEKHKIIVTYDNGEYNTYFDGVSLEKRSNTNNYGGSAFSYIGRVSDGSYSFTGTIYSIKVFGRTITEDEITSEPSNESLLLYLDGSNSNITTRRVFASNNKSRGTTAHSYLTYDLTDVNEDKYLYINASIIGYSGRDYGYIRVSSTTGVSSSGESMTVGGIITNQVAVVKLKKNQVNYVHFIYEKQNWTTATVERDEFVINEVRFFNNLEDAYSINQSGYNRIDSFHFEKPIFNEKVDTIEILKDITLNTPIVVPQEKEVILDLNGFTLTSEKEDYIIKNNGKLTITDSDQEDRQKQNVNYKIEQARLFEEAKTKYFEDVAEYEEYAGLCDGCEISNEYIYDILSNEIVFSYTNSEQSFKVPYTTSYILEVWGAQGGGSLASSAYQAPAGYGGYSVGKISLNKDDILYINVGGKGTDGTFRADAPGGYNGGGAGSWDNGDDEAAGGGGGATHIALESGLLSEFENKRDKILIVAGGGGGKSWKSGGGSGGGFTGGSPDGRVANQTGGYAFGRGQRATGTGDSDGHGGGGGGYYGGYESSVRNEWSDYGGGGSGYIGNPLLTDKSMYCFNCLESTDDDTKTISVSTYSEEPTSNTPKVGHGYVKITPALTSEELEQLHESIDKTYNVKEEPRFVDYLDGIDFINSIDINTLTPADDAEYNNVVSEAPIGGITTTIYNAILNEEYATLIYERGALNINVNSKIGIVNRGNLSIGEYAEINANNSSTIGVYNETNGNIVGFGGVIKAKGSSTIGLLNRSYTPTINGIKVTSSQSNSTDVRNDAIAGVTYTNLDVTGVGTGFTDCSTANVNIVDSNIKSTGNNAYYECASSLPIRVNISSSNLYGTLSTDYSASIINVDNSTLTSIYNYLGYVRINNSSLTSINNNGKIIVNSSTLSGSGTILTNNSTRLSGRSGVQHNSSLILRDSIINSTATSATTVINNTNDMIISNVKINNIKNVSSTAISNSPGSDNGAYLSVVGNTIIDSSFGIAINNTGTLTIGSSGDNTLQEFEYGYTGHQEEFVAPEDGYYKLETWGASSGRMRDYSYDGFWLRGGFGGYASGVTYLHAGDKLYIHVGQAGVYGNQYYGSYNGGGYSRAHVANGFGDPSSGGGATDISLSSEDNHWAYDNGISLSVRSNASYEQRILVAGGGGICAHNIYYNGYDINYSTCSGGYATSSTQLGYGANSGGGGYYGGTTASGGSSYVSDTLTNAVMKTGNEEMPDYTSSGLVKGNMGNGFAKISLLSSDNQENVQLVPTISAVNYGITGSGRVIYYDGTITANTSVNSDISDVPEGYDIYNSKDENNKEKMILVANSNSRPVEQGEEEFVAAIGNAKYTTIQNAVNASNNGDEIDLLVDIQQQNMINIPEGKIVNIDYNGHTVKSYNNNYLFNNLGNLTLTDSQNALNKNTFYGDKYIYNEGVLNVSNIYISNSNYTVNLIQNNGGTATLDSIKVDFGSSISSKTAMTNSANGTLIIKNSTLNLYNVNNMINNLGSLTFKDNIVTGSANASVVVNEESGTAILDGNAYSVSGNDDNGRYFINNKGNATIKNMSNAIEDFYNTGVLTLEDNNITSGTVTSSGLLIINSGTYNNTFNISGTGKTIDDTDKLYSFIIHDGDLSKNVTISSTGITNIESGSIINTSGNAINNSGAGIINLGIKDGVVESKENTKPIITGKNYGINTTNPSLIVNFYDGIVSGSSSYNVTVEELDTGYTLKREYDETNNIETKYLTNEPMFKNVTQNINYGTVEELNNALTDSVNNNDNIEVYRNITITKNDSSITIPSGLNITLDINGSIVDKNNEFMITNNGELTIIDSDPDSKGKIDSTIGKVIINNGTLNISGGQYISEKYISEVEVIKNNENATLNISGGTFTKYYDTLGYRQRNSGAIIVNDGNVNVTGGKFFANGSYVLYNYRRIGGDGNIGTGGTGESNYFYTSAVFVNNSTGNLIVTGGEYDGITSASYEDYYGWQSYSTTNKGELIYNYGTASFTGITSDNSHIGRNDGTMTMDNVIMEKIVNINSQRYSWNSNKGSQQNLINTGSLTIENSSFKLYSTLVDNRGNLDITNTTIDRLGNGTSYSNEADQSWLGPQNSYVVRTVRNSSGNNYTNISNSTIYNKGSGEAIYNNGLTNIIDTTIETSSSSSIISISGTVNVSGQTSITSNGNSGISISNSIFNLGEPISIDSTVSKTYPMIKGNTYGVSNSSSTFNFYDGIIMGKTNRINGVINTIEDGYTIVEDVDGDYKTNYLDRIPIIQNVTQATASDEKKYYDLETAFSEVQNGDTLKMISSYSSLPTSLTAENNANITFDLNGKFIRQTNNILLINNGTMNIIDSSEDKTGQIIGISGSKVIDNFGTINFTSGKITSSSFRLIIKNNASSILNIKEEAKIDVSNTSTLVDNDGTLNITNGAYLHNHAGSPNSFRDTNDGLPMISNKNVLNIIDLNNDDDELTSSTYDAPKLNSAGVLLHGFPYWFELGYYDSIIRNTSTGNVTIYGGTFNNGSTTSPDYGKILQNYGTVVMKNMNSYAFTIGFNVGTLIVENSTFNNFCAGGLTSPYGSLTIRNTSFNFYQPEFDSSFYGNNDVMHIGNATLDHVTFTGGQHTYTESPLRMINIVGPSEIIDSSINLIAETRFLYNESTLKITNTPINIDKVIENVGTLTFDNSNINVTNSSGITNSGTVNFENSDLTVVNGTAISNSGRINFNTPTTVSTTKGNGINNSGRLIIPNGVSVTTQDGYGIYLEGEGRLDIGEIGGVPSLDDPYIEGSTFGIYNSSVRSALNFYDGVVIGAQGPNAIYGQVTGVESGYQTQNLLDINDNKYHENLTVSATSVAVATVGTYTFSANDSISPSRALQNAINHVIDAGITNTPINLVIDVDLTNDEFSLTASEPVTINTNGHEVKSNNTYTVSSNITLNDNGTGGNVSRLLASIISPVTRDVIIYEMSDGNSLDVNKTYKLYKNGELIKLSKEEFGKYSYKGDNEDLVPIKGRLYINDLTSGSYRLLSSDNRYIEFSIDDEGHVSGNVSEYISKNYGSTSKANAELILTIQTGIKKHYYLLAIIPISLLIIALIVIIRKRKVS